MHVHLMFCTLVSLFKYDDESIQIFFSALLVHYTFGPTCNCLVLWEIDLETTTFWVPGFFFLGVELVKR